VLLSMQIARPLYSDLSVGRPLAGRPARSNDGAAALLTAAPTVGRSAGTMPAAVTREGYGDPAAPAPSWAKVSPMIAFVYSRVCGFIDARTDSMLGLFWAPGSA